MSTSCTMYRLGKKIFDHGELTDGGEWFSATAVKVEAFLAFGDDYQPDFKAYCRYLLQKYLFPGLQIMGNIGKLVTIFDVATIEELVYAYRDDFLLAQKEVPYIVGQDNASFDDLFADLVIRFVRESQGRRVGICVR